MTTIIRSDTRAFLSIRGHSYVSEGVVIEASDSYEAATVTLTRDQALALKDFIEKKFAPPPRTIEDFRSEVRAMPVGSQFSIITDADVSQAVKISTTEYFHYGTKAVVEISNVSSYAKAEVNK